MLTPYELSLLIHFHTTPARFSKDETRLYLQALETFVKEDIVKFTGFLDREGGSSVEHGLKLTVKGKLWLDLILNTPLPQKAYLDRDNKIIWHEYIKITRYKPLPLNIKPTDIPHHI